MSEQEAGTKPTELLRTQASWNGAAYAAYPVGVAEAVVMRIDIPAHGVLPWHVHPMPSFAYILAGSITVEDEQGDHKVFHTGEVMPETVGTVHRGTVGDEPATFIVFYAGVKGQPLSEKADGTGAP